MERVARKWTHSRHLEEAPKSSASVDYDVGCLMGRHKPSEKGAND